MTTARFAQLNGSTIQAIAAVKKMHCMPPAFAPTEPVVDQTPCPKCKSRINYSVDLRGMTSGKCVSADCVRWSLQ